MTPLKVSFTGLEFDPADLLPRIEYGIVPMAWQRVRFVTELTAPLMQINQWLTDQIEGRWAIFTSYENGTRRVTIAFERQYEASVFLLADGPRRCALPPER